WGGLAVLLALAACILVWASRRRASPDAPADPALLAAGGAAALLAAASVWDLLPAEYVAAGWLAVAVAAALAARRLGDLALATVAVLAGVAGVARGRGMVGAL